MQGLKAPAYGIRERTDDFFSLNVISDVICAGITPPIYKKHVCWKNSRLSVKYDGFVFEPNESTLKPTEYNLYVKHKMKEPGFDVT